MVEPGKLLNSVAGMISNEDFAELEGVHDERALSALQVITTTMSALQSKARNTEMESADGKSGSIRARKEAVARLWSFASEGVGGAGRALCAALAICLYPKGVRDVRIAIERIAGALATSFVSVNPNDLDRRGVIRLRTVEAFLSNALIQATSTRDRKRDRHAIDANGLSSVAEAATGLVVGALKGRFMDTDVWHLLKQMITLEGTSSTAGTFRKAASAALARFLPPHSRFYPVLSTPRPTRANPVDLEALKGEVQHATKASAHAEQLRKYLEQQGKKAAFRSKDGRNAKGHEDAPGESMKGLDARMADALMTEVALERALFFDDAVENDVTISHATAVARCLCSAVHVDPAGWLYESFKSGIALVPLLLSCYGATQGEVDVRLLDTLAMLSEAAVGDGGGSPMGMVVDAKEGVSGRLQRTATLCTYGFIFGDRIGSLHGKLLQSGGGTASAFEKVAAWEETWDPTQARRLAANFPVDRRLPDELWRALLAHEGTHEKLRAMLIPREDFVPQQVEGVPSLVVEDDASSSEESDLEPESDRSESSSADSSDGEEVPAGLDEDEEEEIQAVADGRAFRLQSIASLQALLSADRWASARAQESKWQRDWWRTLDEDSWLSLFGARPPASFRGDDSVADPCAYLPSLLLFLVAAHGLGDSRPVVDYPKLMAQGFVAPALSGCSARDPRLRAIAYACLDLCMRGLARVKGRGAPEAQHLGMLLAKLRNTVTHPCERLPCVLTSFCAEASVALATPGDFFGSIVASYILNKGGHRFDLGTIKAPPLFNRTFNDPNPRSQYALRRWGLRLLTSSLRDTHERDLMCRFDEEVEGERGSAEASVRVRVEWVEAPNPGYLHDAERVRRSNLMDAVHLSSGSSYYNAPDGDGDIADRFTLFQGITRFARAHMDWSLDRVMDPLPENVPSPPQTEAVLRHLFRITLEVYGSAFDCSDGLLKLIESLASLAMRDAGSKDVSEPMFGISRPDHPLELARAKLRCSVLQESALWLDRISAQAMPLIRQSLDRKALEAQTLHDPASILTDHLQFVAVSFRDALVTYARSSRDVVRPGLRVCFPRALVTDILGVCATLARVLQEGHNLGTYTNPSISAPAMLASASLCTLGDALLVSSPPDAGDAGEGVGPALSPTMATRQPVRPLLSPQDAHESWALGGPGRSLLYVLLPHPDSRYLFHLNETGCRTRLQTSIICWTMGALAHVLTPLVSPDNADRLALRFSALSAPEGAPAPPVLDSAADAARLALRVAAYAADVVDELCTPSRRRAIIGVDAELTPLQLAALKTLGGTLLRPLPLIRIAKQELQATLATGRGAGSPEGSPTVQALVDAVGHSRRAEAALVAALEQIADIPGLGDADAAGFEPGSLDRALKEKPPPTTGIASEVESHTIKEMFDMSDLAADFADKMRFPWEGAKPGDTFYDDMVEDIRAIARSRHTPQPSTDP